MTDYVLFSAVQAADDTANDSDEYFIRIHDLITGVSEQVEISCNNRRFDRRLETLYADARPIDRGGRVVGGTVLLLEDDLQALTELKNNVSEVVSAADYALFPFNIGAPYKTEIHLDNGLAWRWENTRIPGKAISLTGEWGYGGRWKNTGLTVASDQTDSQTTLALSGVGGLEYRQILKIGSEYQLIDAEITASPITVERAVNGSTGAGHAAGAVVYKFIPDALAQRLVMRIIKWYSALDDSPLVGTVQVGDFSQPIDLTHAPADVAALVEYLKRPESILGVNS